MTLQELLRKSSFARAFDYITRMDPRAKGCKFCFQTAWEYLCQMKAQPGYQVEIRKRTQPFDTAPDINVACPELDGYPWKMAMGGEVVLAPDTCRRLRRSSATSSMPSKPSTAMRRIAKDCEQKDWPLMPRRTVSLSPCIRTMVGQPRN